MLTVFKTRCWLSLSLCWKNYCQHPLFLRETLGKLVPSPVIKIRRERKGKKLYAILWHRQCQRKTLEIINILAKNKNETDGVIPVRSMAWDLGQRASACWAFYLFFFFFSFSALFPCACISVCVCICTHFHEFCLCATTCMGRWEDGLNAGPFFPLGLPLFFNVHTVYARLASLRTSGNSPAFTSHLAVAIVDIPLPCSSLTWVLEVLSALCFDSKNKPLSHLSNPVLHISHLWKEGPGILSSIRFQLNLSL